MNDAMRHRGPDDAGTYLDRATGTALGARRLSIIDVEGGHQPVSNEDGTIWAVLNGELYNHPELQSWLRRHGHVLRSRTDTEVLVHLYEELGEDLAHALEGMFAFALWDERRASLLVARDRFGEKPLFYAEHATDEVIFASELSALLASGVVPDGLSAEAVDLFFIHGYVPGPGTIFGSARQLPPGHRLRWQRGAGVRIDAYWLPPETAPVEQPFPYLVAETRQLLDRSVRSRMISDVPLGVFLSGGVDSSLIAALAAAASGAPIKTFTVGYDVGDVNETVPARAMAEQLGAQHHELVLTLDDAADRATDVLTAVDQPLADPAFTALAAVAELARQEVTVVIGGEGADELFAGYPRYQWLERAVRLDHALPERAAAAASTLIRRAAGEHVRGRRLSTVIGREDTLSRHLSWVTAERLPMRHRCYGERLVELSGGDAALRQLSHLVDGSVDVDPAAGLMRLDQRLWLPDDVLMKADRAGMLVSLEIRTPYLHREIAEFAASVAPRVHMQNGGKALLRGVLAELVPSRNRRPKTAFRVPVGEWLRGSLGDVLREQLTSGPAFQDGWFDRIQTGRLLAEHAAGTRDRSDILWPLLSFSLWLDRRSRSL